MRVRAINTGFYNGLHIPGTDSEEFEVPEGSKASWFVPVKKARKPTQDADQSQGSDDPQGGDSLV